MPIFSLPSRHGIGSFGKEAYRFVDFLKKAGQSYWQILPLNTTDFGNSPYQSFSSSAGNPYFIDLDVLVEEGLLLNEEIDIFPEKLDYDFLREHRFSVLEKAYRRFNKEKMADFVNENRHWLYPYSLFMALREQSGSKAWTDWEAGLKYRDENALKKAEKELSDKIDFHNFMQFKFYEQWTALKSYANENGIKIIGDMPIYVSFNSADIWWEPEQFYLDESLNPKAVAGVPPDLFSEEGQLWGMPLYDWKRQKEDSYSFWKRRLSLAFSLYDVVRIDHFRGFESYYAIPFGAESAKEGKWQKGPGMSLFKELKKHFGTDLPIIAEDLGFLTPQVKKLLSDTGFPGMKVLQFAFSGEEESDYLPHNFDKNCVVYTGTHDNDTVLGWAESISEKELAFAKEYMRAGDEALNWVMIKTALSSVADTAIITMPDLIGLSSEGRINTPSTVGGNWSWRIDGGCINDWLAGVIKNLTELYFR